MLATLFLASITDLLTFVSGRIATVSTCPGILGECLVRAGVSQGSIPGPTFFQLNINDLSDNVFCNIAIFS